MKYDTVFRNCLIFILIFTCIYWLNFTINTNTKYLFGWDEIQENDSDLFREYLEQSYGIDWVNLALMLIFVLLSILIFRILPKDKVYDKEIIGDENLVKAYELKFIIFIIFLLFLFYQLISLVSKKDGYFGNTWIIFSIGVILMSYPSNMEDIIYILHKLNLSSPSKEASANWYYLFGYKIDKIFKNELLEDLKAFQRPQLYMHFLAAHSTFNCSYGRDILKEFYRWFLKYLLEKDFLAGAYAVNILSNEIDEIKLLNQKGKLKSSSIGFEFNDLKNDIKMRIDRRSILLTHITEGSQYSVFIVISIGLLSFIYIIYWFGGNS